MSRRELIEYPCEECGAFGDGGCTAEALKCSNLAITAAVESAAFAAIDILRDERPAIITDERWKSACEHIRDGFSNALYDVAATLNNDEFVARCMEPAREAVSS